jgi:hypothetical protein
MTIENHKPKGPHLHIDDREIGYVFRGFPVLKNDIIAIIKSEGSLYLKERIQNTYFKRFIFRYLTKCSIVIKLRPEIYNQA